MSSVYAEVLSSITAEKLYNVSHTYLGVHPTGFVVITSDAVAPFPFTVCPLILIASSDLPSGTNPQDVIVYYQRSMGSLETLLYKLYEQYKETGCEKTKESCKRYLQEGLPPRKIVIPCFKRKENLIPVLKRFATIDLPSEQYRPQILLVEHSPFPEIQSIAEEFNCEYVWFAMDPRHPEFPFGQFNKALAYDKAFLFGSPASWYLFHDNDVLVPKDFWAKLDANVTRAKTQFLQPYTHRSLLNLKPAVAEAFRQDLSLADQPITDDMYAPIVPGAPGGSLYLSRERYLKAGGHDPNFCWGYGPEDALFYHKLELIEPIAFADDPPIEMIHLWHPPAAVSNPFRQEMDWFVKVHFKQQDKDQKLAYMKYKEELLKNCLRKKLEGKA
jgi:hypothetical protein